MPEEIKIQKITDTCDCVFINPDEVYYVINDGINEGVTFTIIDFVAKIDNGSIKYDYNPIIVENSFNAQVDGIYNEIREVIAMKMKKYLNEMK